MVPVSFEQENNLLSCPEELEGDDLNVCIAKTKGDLPIIISCWKITKKELEEIKKTGRLWLCVYGTAMPPVALSTESPF